MAFDNLHMHVFSIVLHCILCIQIHGGLPTRATMASDFSVGNGMDPLHRRAHSTHPRGGRQTNSDDRNQRTAADGPAPPLAGDYALWLLEPGGCSLGAQPHHERRRMPTRQQCSSADGGRRRGARGGGDCDPSQRQQCLLSIQGGALSIPDGCR